MSAAGRLREDHGFSMLELVIAMVLMAIVGTSMLALLSATVRTEHVADELGQELQAARAALDRLRKDLRSAMNVRSVSDDKLIELWLDRDQDSTLDAGELLTYQLVADGAGRAELRRWTDAQTAAGAIVLARGLQDAPVFSYDLTPPGTRLVTITVTAVSDSGRVQKVLANSTKVRVRNVAS